MIITTLGKMWTRKMKVQHQYRPVLDAQGWDDDCGYDGVSIESNLAVVGFDIQIIRRQLAYILRSETKLKKFKLNKTLAGISVTLLGENVVTGLKIEDQIAVGKRLALVGNAGTVRSGGDIAYRANLEVHLKSKDFPIEQDQSTLGFSLMKWRGDLGLMAHLQCQFYVRRNSKMAIRVGMNNKQSGKNKTNNSELQAVRIGIVPIIVSILQSIYPGSNVGSSNKLDY
ncbi:hypothetical protein D5086_017377 [Populus alba]|uniref:Uncharacterized protein n=2 Tax=Populus alba TaxID=43335 RepID=A0ACC4BX77_POPAL|nr:hypothetical protein D5086_0000206370 [Populus alba]